MGKFFREVAEELSLYVRYSAYLNAKVEQPGAHKIAGKVALTSRLEKMRAEKKDEDYAPDMPPVDAPHLIAYLWEIGPIIEGPMGMSPVQETDLQAWQSNTGVELDVWESRLIRRLSREYLVQFQRAEKQDCPAPYLSGISLTERRAAVSAKIDALFG